MTTESRIQALLSATPAQLAAVDAVLAGHAAAGPDRLLTTRQACAVLACHRATLFRYARDGRITPVRRSARCLRWRESEVKQLGEA